MSEVAHRVKKDRELKKTKPNNFVDPMDDSNKSFSQYGDTGEI